MLYQRLQRKRILRLVVFTAAVALLCVLAQLSLSQGSLAAGAVLFEASAPQPETLCTLPASPSQALPSPQDFLHHALARNLSLPGGQQEEPAPQQEEPAPQKPFRIALTFDDGPGPYTGRLLDGLAQYNAKATFFCAGLPHPRQRNAAGPYGGGGARDWKPQLFPLAVPNHGPKRHLGRNPPNGRFG